jgi:hypothetical protein
MKRSRKSTKAPSTASEWPSNVASPQPVMPYKRATGQHVSSRLDLTPAYFRGLDPDKQPPRPDSKRLDLGDHINVAPHLESVLVDCGGWSLVRRRSGGLFG